MVAINQIVSWCGSAKKHAHNYITTQKKCLLIMCLAFSYMLSAQKVYNVLDWKAETSLNTYLLQQMHSQYDQRRIHFQKAIRSKEAVLQYSKEIRSKFLQLVGKFPAKTSLNPQITGVIKENGYRIEKLVYESFSNHHVTANLYIPEGKGPFPSALLFCGHEDVSKATPSYQQTAILFAKNGFIVMVIDPISQSERYQLTDADGKPLTRGGTTEHTLLNASSNLLGSSTPAYELWDNVRGLDYLVTRKEVDTARIGCLGNSGGGIQAIYFAAYDPRIKIIAPCSYLADRERTLELSGPADGCAQIPGEGKMQLEMSDYLLAAAPKPLLILAGRYDFIDYTGTLASYKELKQVYRVLGKPENVQLFSYDDGHGISKPKREAAISWFRKWFYHDTASISEPVLVTHTDKELFSTATGQVNTTFTNEITIPSRNLSLFDSLFGERKKFLADSRQDVIDAIARLLSVNTNTHEITVEEKGIVSRYTINFHKLLIRKSGEVPLPLLVAYPASISTKTVIWFHDRGKAIIADSVGFIESYLKKNQTVIIADLRGMGETEDKSEFNDAKFYNKEYRNTMLALHIGQPLAAQRTTDILTILDFVTSDAKFDRQAFELHATGVAALPALYAVLFNKRVTSLHTYQTIHSFKDILARPVEKNWYAYVVPGVLHLYDLPDLVKLAGSGRVINH